MPRKGLLSLFGLALLLLPPVALTQTTPTVGLRDNTPKVHALTNVRIVQGPGRVIENGTVIIRDGTIEAVGANVKVPADARVWDHEGMTVYPGLIELYSHLGLPKKKSSTGGGGSSGSGSGSDQKKEEAKGIAYWNDKVTPERNVIESFKASGDDLKNMRKMGFTTALLVPNKGIVSGSAALVNLADGAINDQVAKEHVAQCVNMAGRMRSRDGYPNSLMGRISLIRQVLLDARWYGAAQQALAENPAQDPPETNEALAALGSHLEKNGPFLFAVSNDLNVARIHKIAEEYDLESWIRGSGYEYRLIAALKDAGTPVIVPVNFPKAPDVDSPEKALEVNLSTLQHWEMAPANASLLAEAGVQFALTTSTLKKSSDFPKKVREAIKRGLSKDDALAALTTTPAEILGMSDQLGSVDKGKTANIIVADGDLFDKDTKIIDVWVTGNVHSANKKPEVDPRGNWALTINSGDFSGEPLELTIEGEVKKLKGSIEVDDSTSVELKKAALDQRRLTVNFAGGNLGMDGVVRMSAAVERDRLIGQGQLPNGDWFKWSATPLPDDEDDEEKDGDKEDKEKSKKDQPAYTHTSPPGAYGNESQPERAANILIKNATIWTCAEDASVEQTDVLISAGKIKKIGKSLKAPSDAVVIDGEGKKHITPGLIDAHSHTGMSSGVNESGQAVTAEVRVGDVVNNQSVAWYRELAGGLTAAQQLHGSANPIGGQSQTVKLRWGASPEEMKIDDAPPGIKFALGENVKQSNWGERYNTRYPQTRMGVEQLIRDRLKAAQDYQREWAVYRQGKKKGVIPPRRDLELDTLVEVLDGKRMVHSHSYRQDEILMLVRIADDFGFRMGTFQHVLEGYKVAEVMAKHGAHASTFSDWWAYKFEVYDAIPYNGALMHEAGVVVSFNSDSSELARRMNLEAAKAVKYGAVSQEEALKFVTLNAAKQLHIEHRTGSLEVGKDADFVVWSGHPLSTYSICEQTWVDGRQYFDLAKDREMRERIAAERNRLIQKILDDDDDKKKKEKKEKQKPTTAMVDTPHPEH